MTTVVVACGITVLLGLVIGAWITHPPGTFYIDAEDNPDLAAAENQADQHRLDARTLAAGDEYRAHLDHIDAQVAAFRADIEAFERGRWVR